MDTLPHMFQVTESATVTPTDGSTSRVFISDNFASKQMADLLAWLEEMSQGWGLTPATSSIVAMAIAVSGVLLVCFIADFIGKIFIKRILHRPLRKYSSVWASETIEQKVLE